MSAPWQITRMLTRRFASGAAHGGHGADPGKTAVMWERIFIFVAVPICALAHVNCYLMIKEEEENFERPPFKPYEYMRIRTRPYPWGDGKRTLFHNPHVNALPDGYEDEH